MKPEDRLRDLDLIDPPDQWPDIVGRRPRLEPPGHRGARAATIALALAVAAAGIGLAAVAFLWESEPTPPPRLGNVPSSSPEASPAPFPSPQRNATHSDPWGDPRALHITCRDGTTVVASLRVPAQPDGVHILVRNPDGSAKGFHAFLTREQTWPSGHFDDYRVPLEAGLNRVLLPLPPGPADVRCGGEGYATEQVPIDVRDPRGLWVANELPCEDTVPFVRRADRSAHPDVETAMRIDVPGVRPGDQIVKTGYPADRYPLPGTWTMLVVRDGEPVAAIIVVYADSENVWTVFTGQACAGSGIRGR